MTDAMTRVLKFKEGDDDVDVIIRISWPIADKFAWDCRWQIDWPDRVRSNSGRGIDAPQAFVSALQMIAAEIYCSDEHRSGRLTWNENWSGYGFPVSNGIREILIGDDAKFL